MTWLRSLGTSLVCIFTLVCSLGAPVLAATSAFESAPSDPRAITVKGQRDGRADDTDAIQRALDQAAERPGGGVVFLPSGRYRISRTLLVWPSVRVFGVGPTRPVLFLGNSTPGFQKGVGSMVVFTGARRGDNARGDLGRIDLPRVPFPPPTVVPFDPKIWDANPSTFYSAMSNVDVEIGAGNPAATRHSLSRRPARLSQPHGFQPGVGIRRHLPGRQRRPRSALSRWALWHRHREDLACLAVHGDRFDVRRAEERGDP